MKEVLIMILFFATVVVSRGQEKFTGNYEPFIQLEYDLSENYSHEFTIEGRVHWYEKEEFKFQTKQIDLAHFSTYKLNKKNAVALGIQYRFEENFGGNDENEIRITEEYEFTNEGENIEWEHRMRAEQRFAGSTTSHRFRYKFEIKKALFSKEEKTGGMFLTGSLETLLTVAKDETPEYEQRIAAGTGWPLNNFTELEFGLEYRLDNFTQNLEHELLIVTGINFNL